MVPFPLSLKKINKLNSNLVAKYAKFISIWRVVYQFIYYDKLSKQEYYTNMNGCKCIYKTKQIKPIIFIINNSNNNNNLAVDIPRGGSSCCTEFSWIEFRMLVFAQGGNPEDLEKNP